MLAYLKEVIETINDWVWETDAQCVYTYSSPQVRDLLGYDPSELAGKTIFDFMPPEEAERIKQVIALQRQTRQRIIKFESVNLHREGHEVILETSGVAIMNSRGEITGYRGVDRDVTVRKREVTIQEWLYHTRQKQLLQKIRQLSRFDSQTELPNHDFFYQYVQDQLLEAAKNQSRLAVLYLDLDGFDQINAEYGHLVGDQILRKTARRLNRVIGDRGILTRLGGDEFIALLSRVTDVLEAQSVAAVLLQSLSRPIRLHSEELTVSLSIGVSCFPEDADDVETLIRYAYEAMCQVKESGKNGYQCYNKLKDIMEIRKALQEDQFQVYYQPLMDTVTGKPSGMEALIRWQHPARGLLTAGEFISQAERMDLVSELDAWMLSAVCKQIKRWQEAGFSPPRVAVNLSMRTFLNLKVSEFIARIFRETGVESHLLVVEVTESWMMQHPKETIQEITRLKEQGVTVALDDFGTGFSSLNYLKQFPIDLLKIDKSFIKNIATNDKDLKIVQTIVDLAHHLDLKVVAEGVEALEQLNILRRMDCDYSQGYLLGQPVPANEIEKYFSS